MNSIRDCLVQLGFPVKPSVERMIQDRIASTGKLVPPKPLPYVSRRALSRVKDPLPVPTKCPHCNGAVTLEKNSVVYRGKTYGDWPYVYVCLACPDLSYVGLHPNTDLPLGTLANRATRDARKAGKPVFNKLVALVGRDEAYRLLQQELKLSRADCHWALFSVAQARAARLASEKLIKVV